ncbi:MAG: hypothetical protein ACRDPC_01095 [Solirubrobacteraceae bacterium]
MAGRRFLLIVAVLMGLTALAASVAPRDPSLRGTPAERRQASPTPAPTEPVPAGEAPVVMRRISTAGEADRVVVRQGAQLELHVSGTEIDSVAVLDKIEPVEPDSAARFHILADEPGEYPIELLDAERRVGTLVVRD